MSIMRLTVFFLFILTIMASCTLVHVKNTVPKEPEMVLAGIDPQISEYFNEYLKLSSQHYITFSKNPVIRFVKIVKKSIIPGTTVIGICHRSTPLKFIDIDTEFWEHASKSSRKFTIFHELGHCMCGRDHDFAEGKEYKEEVVEKVLNYIYNRVSFQIPEGYYDDWCPKSIMHPTNNDDSCYEKHYSEYVNEMFERCKPI